MQALRPEAEQQARLRRMQLIAVGLLVLMALVFVATFHLPDETWVGYLRAFAEASMVGALADWFAVSALFRHPLGIPIPHTAIIPRRKDEIGENLGRFVSEHFLVADALRPRLAEFSFSQRMSGWLSAPGNAEKLSADGGSFARWVIRVADDRKLRDLVQRHLHFSLREIRITPLVGHVIDLLSRGKHAQTILDASVTWATRLLDTNRGRIRERVGEESPWWIPAFVDRGVYDRIVEGLEDLLDRVGSDESHPARAQFNRALEQTVRALVDDPDTIARGEAIKRELLDHPAVGRYLEGVWDDLGAALLSRSDQSDGLLQRQVAEGLRDLAARIEEDEELRGEIDAWFVEVLAHLVLNYRAEIANIISETIKTWDPDLTARRIELQVGRDLQFIRINGTLVGGLVGIMLHAMVGFAS
jgi:uncharacterized membrane-anchored protein YjiN (DUF445 family)